MSKLDKDYKKYVETHIKNVEKSAKWLKKYCPELFNKLGGTTAFDNLIKNHDKSKFSKEEWGPYRDYWMGDKWDSKPEIVENFRKAWKHHYSVNKHHPEYWQGKGMPYIYKLEMICDWLSFSVNKNKRELIKFYNGPRGRECPNKKFSQADKIELDKMFKLIEEAINKRSRKINEESELSLLLDLCDDETLNESMESRKAKENKKKFKLFKYCIKFLTEESLAEILKTSKHPVPSGKKQKVKAVRKLLSNMSDNKKEKIINSEIMNVIYETVRKRFKKAMGISAVSGGTVSGATIGTEAGIIGSLLAKDGLEVLAGAFLLIPGAIVGAGVLALSLLGAGAGVSISVEQAKKKISLESSDKIKSIILDDIEEISN